MYRHLALLMLVLICHVTATAANTAPNFVSWPASMPQTDGGVPLTSSGQSEALVVVNTQYIHKVAVTGTPTPTVALETVPSGMSLASGSLTWTPTQVGTTTVTLRATNSVGSVNQTWTIRVIPVPVGALVDGKNAQNAQAKLKIMCMGDSITLGITDILNQGGYRKRFREMMASAGYQVTMVGGNVHLNAQYNTLTGIDNHEGHGGWRAGPTPLSFAYNLQGVVNGTTTRPIPTEILSKWVIKDYQPDIVILMAGTNDVGDYGGVEPTTPPGWDGLAQNHLGGLINKIWDPANRNAGQAAPRIIVLPILQRSAKDEKWNIGQGIAGSGGFVARTQTGTSRLVTDYQRTGKPITFADANRRAVDCSTMTTDGTHPKSTAYYNAMAQTVFRAVLDVTTNGLGHDVTPSPPSGMTAVAGGSGLNVTWADNSGNEDAFEVDWSIAADFSGLVTVSFPAGTKAATLLGLPNATPVYVRVRATNAGGRSWYCPPVMATTGTYVVAPPSISTTSLPDGTVGAVYSQVLQASNSPTSWTVIQGALPGGLILRPETGYLEGVPSAAGTFNFTVRAANTAGNGDQALSITTAFATPIITTTSLPTGMLGIPYSQTLLATNGPNVWAISLGSLPAWAHLDVNTGVISGTPDVAGTTIIKVTATNAGPLTSAESEALSLVVTDPVPVISTTTLPNAMVGRYYSQQLEASNSPTTWTVTSGSLPGGLTLAANTGILSGTPTTAIVTAFTVPAANSGGDSAGQVLGITITVPPPSPSITTASLASGIVGVAYSDTLLALHDPTSWTISSGRLPTGLTLASDTGIISGMPSVAEGQIFTVTATNVAGSDSTNLSLVVVPAPGADGAAVVAGSDISKGGSGGCGAGAIVGLLGLALMGFGLRLRRRS